MSKVVDKGRLFPMLNKRFVLVVGCGEVVMVSGPSLEIEVILCDEAIALHEWDDEFVVVVAGNKVRHKTKSAAVENYIRVKTAQQFSKSNKMLLTHELIMEAIRMVGVEHWPQEGE